ncbi:hypothetical protein LEN26_017405 [Aphanomyces euteiches]|nr:hypothetical protein LEN26_017405 [Aphanomyces euteiches]KAH9103778.1 hypothetical protein AeMF1_019971 [Aphanomyces euteiches]KAH9188220.1 hypothetical protein AeNC1_009804 [Aphanomyces euteiches]
MTMSGLPAQLWGYALDHVVYVYNNTPQELLNQRTPYEVLFTKPSRLHMLKTFGCLAYMYVPKLEHVQAVESSDSMRLRWLCKGKIGLISVQFQEAHKSNLPLRLQGRAPCNPIPPLHGQTCAWERDRQGKIYYLPGDNRQVRRRQRRTKCPKWEALCSTENARTIKKPKIYEVNSVSNKIVEPQTFRDVYKSEYRRDWIEATNTECQAMLINNVWELVPLPADRKTLKCMWVWKVKYDADESLERFEARLCLMGYLQIAGVDFTDTYAAPVLRLHSLGLLCALVATLVLETAQRDVKTAFLNGDLDEDNYMEQPER